MLKFCKLLCRSSHSCSTSSPSIVCISTCITTRNIVSSDESSRAHATRRSDLSKHQQNPIIDSRCRKAKRHGSFESNTDSNCSFISEARPSFPRGFVERLWFLVTMMNLNSTRSRKSSRKARHPANLITLP